MQKSSRIWVAGHRGLVGSAICRNLQAGGYTNLITRTSSELNLLDQSAVARFYTVEKPEFVFLAAAKVGGILANQSYPAEFIHHNLTIQTNVIHQAYRHQVKKLLFLGSSCIYPKLAPQPIKETDLLTGPLEPTNAPYAVAKIAGLQMVAAYNRQYGTAYISAMPTNLYGPGDNFNLENAHVLPALIRKFHDAKHCGHASVTIWGTGQPRREFLYVDDLASACIFLMHTYHENLPINVGTGKDISIAALAEMISQIVGFKGTVQFDPDMPDGTPRKLLDVGRLTALGWQAPTRLADGLRQTYQWYRTNLPTAAHA